MKPDCYADPPCQMPTGTKRGSAIFGTKNSLIHLLIEFSFHQLGIYKYDLYRFDTIDSFRLLGPRKANGIDFCSRILK